MDDTSTWVVGRIDTPSWGKPGAARYYGDLPWGHRAETRVSTTLQCHGILDSVANKNEAANKEIKKTQKRKRKSASFPPCSMRVVGDINLSSLILLAGICSRIRGRPYV
ncbi:hypothetical protein XU18_3832 [Perkinsela sp. CCAP 1560/4]|nr:hypothetical protein XU18_3832 [Perkinsela sp. CCAP 1560/4]|eukprot:KNH05057.1 hypothetical protein XU18_3832 [Perkinsela sp. CCAP 1560/4]